MVENVNASESNALVLADCLLQLRCRYLVRLDSSKDAHISLQVDNLLLLDLSNLLVTQQVRLHVLIRALYDGYLLFEVLVFSLMLLVELPHLLTHFILELTSKLLFDLLSLLLGTPLGLLSQLLLLVLLLLNLILKLLKLLVVVQLDLVLFCAQLLLKFLLAETELFKSELLYLRLYISRIA